MNYSERLRIVAVIWLLTLVSYMVIVLPIEQAQTTIGLFLGTIATLIVAEIGVRVTRGNMDGT